jgi:hypothetical protein
VTSIYIRASTDLPERRNADHYPNEHNITKAALDEFCPSGGNGSIRAIPGVRGLHAAGAAFLAVDLLMRRADRER